MELPEFEKLVRDTLERELADTGLALTITVGEAPDGWTVQVEVHAPVEGTIQDAVGHSAEHAEIVAFAARLVDQVRQRLT